MGRSAVRSSVRVALALAAATGAACHGPASREDAPRPVASDGPSAHPGTPSPAPVATSSYHARPVTDGHAVEVRVVYAGKPRPTWKLPSAFASHCGGATEVADPSVEVDAKGGVTGAVAWIDDLHEGEPLVSADVVLDQKSCAFSPHVVAMATGAKLSLTNGDPANHAMRLDFVGGPDDESIVKMVPPGNTDVVTTRDFWAGRVGRATCPIHPWMLAWVHFFDHPYFAVTRGGVARIAKVPPGTWHLSVWHEATDAKMGEQVTEGAPVRARFDVTVGDRDVVKTLTLSDDGTIAEKPPGR